MFGIVDISFTLLTTSAILLYYEINNISKGEYAMIKKLKPIFLSVALLLTALSGCSGGNKSNISDGGTHSDNSLVNAPEQNKVQSAAIMNTQQPVLAEINGNLYYTPHHFYRIDGLDCKMVSLSDEEQKARSQDNNRSGTQKIINTVYDLDVTFDRNTILCGNEYYGKYNDFAGVGILKVVMQGEKELEESTLYSPEMLADSLGSELMKDMGSGDDIKEEAGLYIWHNIHLLQEGDDEYIYFLSYNYDSSYFSETIAINFCLGRFAKDGTKIEYIKNIRAADYVIAGDRLFYYDNGYTYTGNNTYTVQAERAGLYSADKNGSNAKKLLSVSITDKDNIESDKVLINNMSVVGNYLYYCDNTESGQGYLYRMPLDGGKAEKVTANPCINYYVDPETSQIVYVQPIMSDSDKSRVTSGVFFLKKSDSEDETKLFSYPHGVSLNKMVFALYGNDLYFSTYFYNTSFVEVAMNGNEYDKQSYDDCCGQRYHLSTKTMEYLYVYRELYKKRDVFGSSIEKASDWIVEWKTAEEINSIMDQEVKKAKELQAAGALNNDDTPYSYFYQRLFKREDWHISYMKNGDIYYK